MMDAGQGTTFDDFSHVSAPLSSKCLPDPQLVVPQ